jgi:hypothetical protein
MIVISTVNLQSADRFDTRPGKDFLPVGRIWKLGSQILPGKVELFVKIGPPLRTIRHVIDDAFEGY